MLGALFGLGFGGLAGLSVGPYLFNTKPPKDWQGLDHAADAKKQEQDPPKEGPINAEMRQMLDFTEPWTFWPDYERTSMINRVISVMWPNITKAVIGEVVRQIKPILKKQVFDKYSFIEDVVLGDRSLKDIDNVWVDKHFTCGTKAPRLGGIKAYTTADDEVILEVPLLWGSDSTLDVSLLLKFGLVRLYVPIQLANIHFKVLTRITLRPLVETIPCIGGVTVSLLETPHVDLSLRLLHGVDLMALPGVQDVVRMVIKRVLDKMMIYPNGLSVPLMPHFGHPPPAKGSLNVKLLRGEGLAGAKDCYMQIKIRKGRSLVSQTVRAKAGLAEWNEEFNLIVDDFETQRLSLVLFNDDVGWNDSVAGEGTQVFGRPEDVLMEDEQGNAIIRTQFELEEFMKVPMQETLLAVQLFKPLRRKTMAMVMAADDKPRKAKKAKKAPKGAAAATAATAGTAAVAAGSGPASPQQQQARQASPSRGASAGADAAEGAVAAGAKQKSPPPTQKSPGGGGMLGCFRGSKAAGGQQGGSSSGRAGSPARSGSGRRGSMAPGTGAGAQQDPEGRQPMGVVYVKLMFVPFFQPSFDDEDEEQAAKSKKRKGKVPPVAPPRNVTMKVQDRLKGVLTVRLVRCFNLREDGDDDLDCYVRFMLADEEKDEVQNSRIIYNEPKPRWGDLFDFVMISAGSTLHVTVYEKVGVFASALKALLQPGEAAEDNKDKPLGKLTIPVKDIVRNGRLKDVFTLQDAERGNIELGLTWQTCYVQE